MYQQYIMMCQAAWLKIFKSLLDDLVFEVPQEKSHTVSTLTKYCACFIQYSKHTEQQDMDTLQVYMDDIWTHFYRWRRLYLTSTETTDDNLLWLEIMLRVSVINYDDESC